MSAAFPALRKEVVEQWERLQILRIVHGARFMAIPRQSID